VTDTEPQSGDDTTVRSQFNWEVTPPSLAIIETVAEAVDGEPTTIDPLYEYVDPDALDVVVRSKSIRAGGEPTTVSFDFADQRVTVHSDGRVVVRERPSRN